VRLAVYYAVAVLAGIALVVVIRSEAYPRPFRPIQPSDSVRQALRHFSDLHVVDDYDAPEDGTYGTYGAPGKPSRYHCKAWSPYKPGREGEAPIFYQACYLKSRL